MKIAGNYDRIVVKRTKKDKINNAIFQRVSGVGGVSPILFIAAFSSAPYPGRSRTDHMPQSPACTSRDSPFHRFPVDQTLQRSVPSSALIPGRVVSVPLPWVSPPVLAYGCTSGGVGTFLSYPGPDTRSGPKVTVSRTLPLLLLFSDSLFITDVDAV